MGRLKTYLAPLDKFYGDFVETNGDVGDKKKREAQRKEGGSCLTERGWGFPSSSERSLLPGTLGHLILYVFHPQNKPSSYQSPTFGLTLYKFIVMGSVRKP